MPPYISQRERTQARKERRAPRYTCRWKDADGRQRQNTSYTDKALAGKFLARQIELARSIRDGLIDVEVEAARDHARVEISEHLDAFVKHLSVVGMNAQGHRVTEKYVSQTRMRVDRFIGWTGPGFPRPAGRLGDISIDRAVSFIADLEASGWVTPTGQRKPYSPYTINEYIGAMVLFTGWLVETHRMMRDPLGTLKRRPRSRIEDSRTHKRRSLSPDDLARFITATETRPLFAAMTINRGPNKGQRTAHVSEARRITLLATGFERATFYLTQFWTGLRKSETRSLVWTDITFDTPTPFVRIDGSRTKNKKDATITLHPQIAVRLGQLRASRGLGCVDADPVFAAIPTKETFRADLRAAGIERFDGERYVDIHALRMTLSTHMLQEGVGPRLAQEHMRHSDIALTTKTYTDAPALPVSAAVVSMPSLSLEPDPICAPYAPQLGVPNSPKQSRMVAHRAPRGGG